MYRDQSTRHAKGFTLMELMIVLVIAGVLLAIAAPGFRTLLERNRLQAASSNLFASLMLARSEALKRNQVVWVCKGTATALAASCPTGTDGAWEGGWLVHIDPTNPVSPNPNDVIAVREGLGSGDTLRAVETPSTDINAISFRPNGGVSAESSFVICNSDADVSTGREVRISATGRPSLFDSVTSCTP
jgi:type IV fimbrial biogenesis protein FimT